MPELLISGYFGFGNSGDDAILQAMVSQLKAEIPDARICVLSASPDLTRERIGVEAVARFNPVQVLRAVAGADLLISGGGSLLQDATSTRSLVYYLSIIYAGIRMGKKVMLYANGIGPLGRPLNRRVVSAVINRVPLVTLRDEASRRELERLGVNQPRVEVTADPVFSLTADMERGKVLLKEQGVRLDKPLLGISIRPWPGINERILTIAEACRALKAQHDVAFVLLPLQPSKDMAVSEALKAALGTDAVVLRSDYTPGDHLDIISCFAVTLGMRLHSLIYSVVAGVPAVGVSYDPKVSAFVGEVKGCSGMELNEITFEHVYRILSDTLEHREELAVCVKLSARSSREKARRNAELAHALLRSEL
ncbi:MAG: polysaccharide pyruvyl transferase CsaB [Bacillota bacterium]